MRQGYRVRQLVRLCRLPRWPSEALRLREELGLDHAECLDFDIACVEYDHEMERREHATKEETAPKKSKKRQTVQVPKYEPEQLLLWQGIDPAEVKSKGIELDPGITAMADEILTGQADWLYLD